MNFLGINVYSNLLVQPVPRIQVRDIKFSDGTSILSAEFRAKENAWYLEQFGTMNVAYMFSGSPFGAGIVMNPSQIAMLKNFI